MSQMHDAQLHISL